MLYARDSGYSQLHLSHVLFSRFAVCELCLGYLCDVFSILVFSYDCHQLICLTWWRST